MTGAPLRTRARVGIIIPATNGIVETDMHRMAPDGVTVHTARLDDSGVVDRDRIPTDADTAAHNLRVMGETVEPALRRVARVEIDVVALAFVIESAFFGRQADLEWAEKLHRWSGVPGLTAADAVVRALQKLDAKRISIVGHYAPVAMDTMIAYFNSCGFQVEATGRFPACTAPQHCKLIGPEEIQAAIRETDRPTADVVLALGTGMGAVGASIEAERALGKPVLATNEALMWACLRTIGINDQRPDAGVMLREH